MIQYSENNSLRNIQSRLNALTLSNNTGGLPKSYELNMGDNNLESDEARIALESISEITENELVIRQDEFNQFINNAANQVKDLAENARPSQHPELFNFESLLTTASCLDHAQKNLDLKQKAIQAQQQAIKDLNTTFKDMAITGIKALNNLRSQYPFLDQKLQEIETYIAA